jgi:1-acyl-sn-glycerol-3-phosphate acyltransferase
MFYSFLKVVLYVLAKSNFCVSKLSGTENIPQNGPVVIASNHLSLLEPANYWRCSYQKEFILWPKQ